MQDRSQSPPITNMILFAVLFLSILVGYQWVMHQFFPPRPQVANAPNEPEKDEDKAEGGKDKKDAGADKKKASADAKLIGEAATKTTSGTGQTTPKTDKLAVPKAGQGNDKNDKNDNDKNDNNKKKDEAKKGDGKKDDGKPPASQKKEPTEWITLGSVDPDPSNPYRMLVTLGNRGASVARIELSSTRYRDLEDRGGYIGHLVVEADGKANDKQRGCLVQVVGDGTPAKLAGIKKEDRILTVNGKEVDDAESFETALGKTKPDKSVELTIQRDGRPLPGPLTVKLIRRPLEVIRPERSTPQIFSTKGPFDDAVLDPRDPDRNSPLCLLTTLQEVDGDKLLPSDDPKAKMFDELNQELKGVELRQANWTVVEHDGEHAVFRREVPAFHLEVTKTYRLVKVDGDPAVDRDARAYHLELSLSVKNKDKAAHSIAYRLDGPNGLPREGFWYAYSSKVGIQGDAGLRDVVYQLTHAEVNMVPCSELKDKLSANMVESAAFSDLNRPKFFGVDAQYFASALIPDPETTSSAIDRAVAVRLGHVHEQLPKLTNASFRLLSKSATLKPDESITHHYELFAGPKRTALLSTYGLEGTVYYGWPIFRMVAVPMTKIVDFFYGIVHNYGLAIIMLTIVVRLAMFPLSRKQALNAQTMQKLQPEIKRIAEKYKKDAEGRTRAQQELFNSHNYNPLSGCLPLFIQMPIFLGLYRSLQVNVELRDAALFSHGIRWCSNLAAPDMFFNWSAFMPDGVNNGIGFPWFPLLGGMFGLGPYFNLLPMFTLGLFIVQQKVMMPPPADEQAAAQMKMMNYVMILMGFMFFKVAAGLCIYFIASTLWGLGERRFLPKAIKAGSDGNNDGIGSSPRIQRSPDADNAAARRKMRRGKK